MARMDSVLPGGHLPTSASGTIRGFGEELEGGESAFVVLVLELAIAASTYLESTAQNSCGGSDTDRGTSSK